jgi:hypothetical protein
MAQSPMSEREAEYKRRRPKTPIFLYWQLSEDKGEVPRINIENPDENEVADPVFEAYGVESVEELDEMLFGENAYRSRSKHQLGVMAGQKDDRGFFTDEELLGMVEGINDALAAALIDWYNDIPSMCEQIRTGSYTTIYHDAEVEGKEWVDELDALEEIDNLEMAMKDAQIWQEPENVASGAI